MRRDQLIPLLILGLLKEKPDSYGYEFEKEEMGKIILVQIKQTGENFPHRGWFSK